MHLLNNGRTQKEPMALELVKVRILGRPYSKWRAIIAETGDSDTAFLLGLKALHGITIDKQADPMLYMSQDTQQMAWLAQDGVPSPTMCQLLLTSRAFALSEEHCLNRWRQIVKRDSEAGEEPPSS